MKKELITFDQLAALSFLKFAKLDSVDMTLLLCGISNIAEVKIEDDSNDYFIMTDGTIVLEKKYIERFNKNVDRELFEDIIGSSVWKYLDSIDMLEFVLRKIKLLGPGCVVKDEFASNFSSLQIRIIKLLYKEGYIINYLQEDSTYGDYQAVKLTKRGDLYLFLADNAKEVEDFSVLLRANGYDEVLVSPFLITQNLEDNPKDILKLDNFLEFCDNYDYVLENGRGQKRVRVPSSD